MKAATASGIRAIEQGHGAATGNAATEDRSLERRVSDRSETDDARVDRFGDQPLDDEPPATADSPAVQQAWLKRVRELLAKGRHDAARDSLREYQRRYPNAALPDDLRDLLAQ